jgi:hypothetical protein
MHVCPLPFLRDIQSQNHSFLSVKCEPSLANCYVSVNNLSLDFIELLLSLFIELSVKVVVSGCDKGGLPSVGKNTNAEPDGHGVGTEEVCKGTGHLFYRLNIIIYHT